MQIHIVAKILMTLIPSFVFAQTPETAAELRRLGYDAVKNYSPAARETYARLSGSQSVYELQRVAAKKRSADQPTFFDRLNYDDYAAPKKRSPSAQSRNPVNNNYLNNDNYAQVFRARQNHLAANAPDTPPPQARVATAAEEVFEITPDGLPLLGP